MLGPLLFIFGISVLIVGFVSARKNRRKVKDIPDCQSHTSEPEEDIALYHSDREAYYRKLGVYTEDEIREKLEEERGILCEYERMKKQHYGKN